MKLSIGKAASQEDLNLDSAPYVGLLEVLIALPRDAHDRNRSGGGSARHNVGGLLVGVEVTNEIRDRAAGVGYHPMRRLHCHVVDVAYDDLASLTALNDFLPIRSGYDLSAQVNAPRSARENEDVSEVIVAFRGGSYIAALDAAVMMWSFVPAQKARVCQFFHGPDFIRSGVQRRRLFLRFLGFAAGLG